MSRISILAIGVVAALLGAAPLAAHCQMQYNVSVYTDGSVSDDASTVYGYSNFVDNSTRCGCVHSNYEAFITIYAPDGSYASTYNGGTEVGTQMATTAGTGTYNVEIQPQLYCSCAQQTIKTGSPFFPVTVDCILKASPTAFTIAACNGSAQTAIYTISASPPSTCALASSPAPSCSASAAGNGGQGVVYIDSGTSPNPTCSVTAGWAGHVVIDVDSDPGNIAGWVTFAVTATVVDNNQKTTYPVSLSQNGNGNPVQVNCNAK
jgi:hypothetical protein